MRAHPVGKTLAALAVAALTGVTRGVASAQTPKVIKVSIIEATPAFHSLPVTALKTLGADYGLEVETLQIQGGGEAGQIFAGGHGDIMTSGFDKPVGFEAKKLVDAKTFGVILHSMNWSLVVPAKSDVKTVADLKGKTIGISGPGSSSDMLMRWALNKAGLSRPDRDVTLIALAATANLYAGLENARVQAAVLVRPFLTKATEVGHGPRGRRLGGHAVPESGLDRPHQGPEGEPGEVCPLPVGHEGGDAALQDRPRVRAADGAAVVPERPGPGAEPAARLRGEGVLEGRR